MSYRNNTLEGPTTGRSPRVASSLSIFPGLGQIYNSEPRKGVLFMLVGVTNFAVLLFVALSTQFLHLMKTFSQELNLRPNHQLMEALSTVQIGSPVANLLFMLFLCFTVFAMRDAFDRALLLRKQSIYAPSAMHLSEASSGSYLFHIALMLTILLLSFFFLIPPAPRQQVTEIEFVQPDEKTHEKVVTRNRSAVRSRAQQDPNVKRTSRDPHAASSQSRAQAATTRRTEAARPQPQRPTTQRAEAQKPQTQPTPRQAQTTPAQAATRTPPAPAQISHTPPPPRPVPVQRTQNTSAPTPMQAIQPMVSRVAPAPQPQAHTPMFPTIPIPNGLLPMPMQAKSNTSAPTLMPQSVKTGGGPRGPMIATATSGPINAPRPGIEDVKIGTGHEKGPVSPKEIKSDFSGEKDGTNKTPIPGGRKGTDPGKTFTPITPRLQGNGPDTDTNKKNDTPGGDLRKGEPRTASNPVGGGKIGNPNPISDPDIPWDQFMADLQRRIKRAWFPPKKGETLRVKVLFTAHTNGTMSNLRLIKSSGFSLADQAALKAVQNAAPFRPLPEGAPPSVDIEFTFDYNVFHGGGQGQMRRY